MFDLLTGIIFFLANLDLVLAKENYFSDQDGVITNHVKVEVFFIFLFFSRYIDSRVGYSCKEGRTFKSYQRALICL